MEMLRGTAKGETNSSKELVMVKTRLQLIKPQLPSSSLSSLDSSTMNIASSSGSGTFPSNTITNPKEDLKGITTRSGNAYKGPTIPTTSSPPKVVERETEVTKDTVPPTNNGSTKDVQPLVVQVETQVPNFEPVVALVVEPVEAPVSAPKPNPKPSIPYPSRLHGQKLSDKANDQKEKFFQIFQDLDFNISFADALILMPNASINLMPLFVWNKLSLPKLSPTCMTLELTDRLISRSVGVTKYVFVKVGTFHFPADFVVVDFDTDPRVPLILGRSFLKTGRALIDVYEGELTLCVGNKAITFNLDQTLRYSANYDAMLVNQIDLIDVACEEYSQEVLGFFVSGNPTPPWVSPMHCVPKKGGFTIVKNKENELIPTRLVTGWRVCIDYQKLNDTTRKDHFPLSFMDQMLERLAGNEYYCFLDGFSGYFQIPIDPQDQEKTTFTSPYGTFAYRRMPFGLCNASGTFQRCMMAIFHDMIEKTIEVFMDDFLCMRTSRSYFSPTSTIPRRSRKQTTNVVEPEFRTIVEMADNRTMAQMLQAPIEGYEDAIVVPQNNENNFELKQTLINLVQSNQFTGRQDPHNHLRFFNKVTSTFRHPEVPNTTIKFLLFPFSLEGEVRIWLDKEPLRSILTWEDLVLKFINQFFPSSKTTYLWNVITNFLQKPN
nr:reverse transcriptase domain-containing protein [Tanacetum cinerariifolium]